MRFKLLLAGGLATAICATAVCASGAAAIYFPGWLDLNKDGRENLYEDPAQPVQRRVKDLLQRMTLDAGVRSVPAWAATQPWNQL